MPDIFDRNGLVVKTLTESLSDLENGMKSIYGTDINVEQNSPDGQLIGIISQFGTDIRELLVQINASFDPDESEGVILDQRVVINKISRAGGTFTIQPVEITTDRTVTLQGLDGAFNDVNGTGFTVADDAGNQFILVDTITLVPGTYSLNFRARQIGRVEVTAGTITNAVTIVLGVITIFNSSSPLSVGQNQETDPQLRVRRQQSVSNESNGYLNGLLGNILALTGVTDAKVYENRSDATDSRGIPEHGTWLIVEGGSNQDIADVYYRKISYGSPMKGMVEIPITTPSNDIFTAKFDRPTAQDLWIRLKIQRTIPGFVFNEAFIKQYIAQTLEYQIGQYAETSRVTVVAIDAINAQGGSGVPVDVEISKDGVTYTDYLEVDTLDRKWTLDVSRILTSVV